MKEFAFNLGDLVRDKVDGFKGVVVCQMRNITGCLQYVLYGVELNNGGERKSRFWIDEGYLTLSEEGFINPSDLKKKEKKELPLPTDLI